MHIERWGAGPRYILGLHGWSGDHRTFAPVQSHVPADFSFFSADLPGCGTSPDPRAWTVDAVADEVAETVARWNCPVTLVGSCSGANLALFVAARLPERIERVVMIDAFSYWPWYFRVFVNGSFGRYAYFTTFANPFGRWITNLSLRGHREENTSLTAGFARADHRTTYRYLTMLHAGGAVEQFRGLRMPVDIAYGENSFAAVRHSADQLAALFPQAQRFCLSGAGHLPLLEAPAALRDIIFESCRESPCPTHSTICAS